MCLSRSFTIRKILHSSLISQQVGYGPLSVSMDSHSPRRRPMMTVTLMTMMITTRHCLSWFIVVECYGNGWTLGLLMSFARKLCPLHGQSFSWWISRSQGIRQYTVDTETSHGGVWQSSGATWWMIMCPLHSHTTVASINDSCVFTSSRATTENTIQTNEA